MATLTPSIPSQVHVYVTIPSTAAATTVITFSVTGPAASSWGPPEEGPQEARQRTLLQWTLAALQIARERLRASQEDPSGVVATRPRRSPSWRLHDRPRVKGRVCSGASRYRVFRA
jgi:hypothetical protein